MNLSTLLCRTLLLCATLMIGVSSYAAEVTLNGFTTVGESKAIQVTYALNKSQKVARVRRVDDTSTADKKRKSCVIPATITVDKVKYTVKYIGTGAFSHITEGFDVPSNDKNACKFQRVELPNTITEICERAFLGLKDLKYCNIPASVQLIHPYAFMRSGLESAVIPASCTGIGQQAFHESALQSITFAEGSNTLEIGAWAFAWTNITTVVTPKRLVNLWLQAFNNCYSLTDLILNGTLTTIPEFCFAHCEALARVTINAPVVTIEEGAFQGALKNVQSFKFTTNSLRILGYDAFLNTGFTTISPDNVLPEGVTTIQDLCFNDCPKLTTVIFPSTIKTIGDSFRFGSTNIRRIDCYTDWVPECDNTWNGETYRNAVVNVKSELVPQFSKAEFWRYFDWSRYDHVGIDDITADDNATSGPEEYYNLHGERVDADNLTPGIYIRRHNGRNEKILIR